MSLRWRASIYYEKWHRCEFFMPTFDDFKAQRDARLHLVNIRKRVRIGLEVIWYRLESANMLTWRSWRDNLPAVLMIGYLVYLLHHALCFCVLTLRVVANATNVTGNDIGDAIVPPVDEHGWQTELTEERLARFGEECFVGRDGDGEAFRYRGTQWFCAEDASFTASFNFADARDALRMPAGGPRAALRASLGVRERDPQVVTLRGDAAICAALHLRNH